MPDLDLKPDDYRVQTRNGNWTVRDYPWMLIAGGLVGVFFVGFAWWNRAELTTVTLFGGCAMASFLVGWMGALLAKRFD